MKKKAPKIVNATEEEKQENKDGNFEASATEPNTVPAEADAPVKIAPKPNNAATARGLNQKFLDLFWKLAESNADVRLAASIEMIKQIGSPHSAESQLTYTIGRLVQGLASTRECARHGYFITLIGMLSTFPADKLPNQLILDTIKNRLVPEGTKKEKADQHIGQVLAYGALLKANRLAEADDLLIAMNNLLTGSKIKNYIQPIAFGFLSELVQLDQVSNEVFKGTLWPVLKPDLTLSWEQHTLDSLNLLLTIHNRFPKVAKKSFMKECLGCSSIGKSDCFSELTKFILNNPSKTNHPVYARITSSLIESDTLDDFWVNHFDKALELTSKAKAATALNLLMNLVNVVASEMVGKLLSKNVIAMLVTAIQSKDDNIFPSAEAVLESLKAVMVKEDTTPAAQVAIMEQLLKTSDLYAFDKNTDTRFVATVSSSLKKEAVMSIVEIYKGFINETNRLLDKVSVTQHLTKLISHLSVLREVDWKATQIVFLAKWAYFTPSASKNYMAASKEAFHRALDHPCKRLEDLSAVLSKAFDKLSELIPDSSFTEEVKATWNNLLKVVQKVQKKQRSKNEDDSWTDQVFLVLYLNMGFELLREPIMATEIIGELDTCYLKAKQKKPTKSSDNEEPHWLEVVTDILLSLLSRDQHLLRSVVVSVWTMLAEHITQRALQQVLDVIDPNKKEAPLVDADEQESDESELSGEENEAEEELVADEESEIEESDVESMDEEPNVSDVLRMKIHQALGDGAALTDTESVDVDDLSDGQMESLDRALGAAFSEFRKARPPRKNRNKLPKNQTSLMHFRLRCLDLIEVLTDKEVSISVAASAVTPLLSLLEVTVRESLQKPLMDRTRNVLRKLTNVRKFADSSDVTTEDLAKLLQSLLSKSFAKRSLMPYISEDLVRSCCFVLRCTLHLNRKSTGSESNGGVQVDSVFQIYRAHLAKFFMKRDSPIPFGVFSRAFAYPWADAGHLMEPLTDYAFGPSMLKNRRIQALQLLTFLFRNVTALTALGQPLVHKLVPNLLQHSEKVLEEAGSDSKPKYLNELFNLLRVVAAKPKGCGKVETELWEPLKTALASFMSRGLMAKQKEMKKSCAGLARLLGVTASAAPSKQKQPVVVAASAVLNGVDKPVNKKKSKKDKEKKEAKQRRIAASAEGMANVTFGHVDIGQAEHQIEAVKKRKKSSELATPTKKRKS